MSKEGYRYNEGKLRWRNIPLFFIRGLVKVGQFGESKYDTYNFLKGLSVTDSLDSLFRHLDSFQDPHASDFDHESKCNHLFHVAWNALLAAYTLRYKPEFDDRFTLKKNNDDIIMTHCTRIGQIYTHKFEVAFDRDWAKKGDTIGIFKVKKKIKKNKGIDCKYVLTHIDESRRIFESELPKVGLGYILKTCIK